MTRCRIWIVSSLALQDLDRQLARGHHRQQGDRDKGQTPPSVQVGVIHCREDKRQGASGDGAEIAGGGIPEEEPVHSNSRAGHPADALLELAAAAADQVVADVRATGIGRSLGNLTCALDALPRHAHLAITGRLRYFFHRLSVAIAAAEVHSAVHAGWIALEYLFHEADALEELAPVEPGDEAEAADQIGDERLLSRLMLSFRTDGVFHGLPLGGEGSVELMAHRCRGRAVLTRSLEEADHERGMYVEGHSRRPLGALERERKPIGIEAAGTVGGQDIRPGAQGCDQRQPERSGPRPELPNRQWRNGLKSGHEPLQPLGIEASGAASHQLGGDDANSWLAGELVGRHAGEPAVEGRRQVVANVANSRGDDVKVIEKPFGGG